MTFDPTVDARDATLERLLDVIVDTIGVVDTALMASLTQRQVGAIFDTVEQGEHVAAAFRRLGAIRIEPEATDGGGLLVHIDAPALGPVDDWPAEHELDLVTPPTGDELFAHMKRITEHMPGALARAFGGPISASMGMRPEQCADDAGAHWHVGVVVTSILPSALPAAGRRALERMGAPLDAIERRVRAEMTVDCDSTLGVLPARWPAMGHASAHVTCRKLAHLLYNATRYGTPGGDA